MCELLSPAKDALRPRCCYCWANLHNALVPRRVGKQRRYANEISLPLIAEKVPMCELLSPATHALRPRCCYCWANLHNALVPRRVGQQRRYANELTSRVR